VSNRRRELTDDAALPEPTPPYVVQSADHALRLLQALVGDGSLRVTDAAELLDVVPSTAHRLLATLCHRGFAVQERRGGRYIPGPAVAAITVLRGDVIDLRSMARAVLERLREDTQETISLVVLEGTAVHFVDSIDGPQPVRVSSRLGLSRPAHCTSGGKALLALLPRDELLVRYPTSRLAKRSPNSIGTRKLLEAELAEVRSLGYGWNFDEGDSGIGGVGVAIPDAQGRPLAAVTVATPIGRLTSRRAAAILARPVRSAAEELQKVLATHRFSMAPLPRTDPEPSGPM
jgi:IclR family transcriptional regulator, acetate operon repressor